MGLFGSESSTIFVSLADWSKASFFTSVGFGRYMHTASSRSCTPLFFTADPHITGVIFSARVARRMAARSSSLETSSPLRNFSARMSSTSATPSMISDAAELRGLEVLRGGVLLADVLAVVAVEEVRAAVTASMMPANLSSAPMGTWSFTGWCWSFSLSMSATRS